MAGLSITTVYTDILIEGRAICAILYTNTVKEPAIMTPPRSETLMEATSLIAQMSQQQSDYKLTATITPGSTKVRINYGGGHTLRFDPAMIPEMRHHG